MKFQIRGYQKLIGIIGNPISHSLSPVFQNYLIEKVGLDYVYIPFEVEKEGLEDFFQGIKKIANLKGFNVTIPFKEQVLPFLDNLSDEAKAIGAINTIFIENGKILGYNTDIYGILYTLKKNLKIDNLDGQNVLIFGAGGAAKAAIYSLGLLKAKNIYVVNRTKERVNSLLDWSKKLKKTKVVYVPWNDCMSFCSNKRISLIINSTPLGFVNEALPIKLDNFHKKTKVFDMTYGRKESDLIKKAKKEGLVATDGLPMLVAQGVKSFFLWTGFEIELENVVKYLKSKLKTWQEF